MDKLVDVVIEKVDIALLDKQRTDLVTLIWDDTDSPLWGLVELLDYVTDKYLTNPDLYGRMNPYEELDIYQDMVKDGIEL